jgi:hypothetical protein
VISSYFLVIVDFGGFYISDTVFLSMTGFTFDGLVVELRLLGTDGGFLLKKAVTGS